MNFNCSLFEIRGSERYFIIRDFNTVVIEAVGIDSDNLTEGPFDANNIVIINLIKKVQEFVSFYLYHCTKILDNHIYL